MDVTELVFWTGVNILFLEDTNIMSYNQLMSLKFKV